MSKPPGYYAAYPDEAEAEIARLRAQSDRFEEMLEEATNEGDKLRAALEKEEKFTMAAMDKAKTYRAALEEIADDPTGVSSYQAEIAKRVLAKEGK